MFTGITGLWQPSVHSDVLFHDDDDDDVRAYSIVVAVKKYLAWP